MQSVHFRRDILMQRHLSAHKEPLSHYNPRRCLASTVSSSVPSPSAVSTCAGLGEQYPLSTCTATNNGSSTTMLKPAPLQSKEGRSLSADSFNLESLPEEQAAAVQPAPPAVPAPLSIELSKLQNPVPLRAQAQEAGTDVKASNSERQATNSSASTSHISSSSFGRRPPIAMNMSQNCLNTLLQREDVFASKPIRVFVMLPLDTVNGEGIFRHASAPWFSPAINLLAASGVYGVAIDVWWGAVEREPQSYNWTGYKQLVEMIRGTGLKLQTVLSFHACGGNVGDTAQIPLPSWVLQCGESDPDLFFTDRPRDGGLGQRNKEYISIWADDAPGVLCGRSPMQCYEDFMQAFKETFQQELESGLIEEVVVGAGPCGELRYPSYVEGNGWRFPGVGEFQCFDRRALASLAQAAREAGRPEWGNGGPHDAGHYNSSPEETGFFSYEGSWDTPYGRFFLSWYSASLLKHGDRLLSIASSIFGTNKAAAHTKTSSPGGIGPLDGTASEASTCSGFTQLPRGFDSMLDVSAGGQPSTAPLASTPSTSTAITLSAQGSLAAPLPTVSQGQPVAGQADGMMDVEQSETSHTSNIMDAKVSVSAPAAPGQGSRQPSCNIPDSCAPGPGAKFGHYTSSSTITDTIGSGASLQGYSAPPSRPAPFGNSVGSFTAECSGAATGAGPFQNSEPYVDLGNLVRDSADDNASDMGGSCMTPDAAADDTVLALQYLNEGEYVLAGPPGSLRALSAGGERACAAAVVDGGDVAAVRPRNSMDATAAPSTAAPGGVILTLKVAGIHWWFRSRSHAAELTAGYYNTATRDGYAPLIELCAKHGANITLTCVEMCDGQHPGIAMCGPEGLLKQIRTLAARSGVRMSGENALPIFLQDGVDTTALDRIVFNMRAWHGAAAAGFRHIMHSASAPVSGQPSPSGPYSNSSYSSYGSQAYGNIVSLQRYPSSDVGLGMRGSYGMMGPSDQHKVAATGLKANSYADIVEPIPPMHSFTFLRLGPELLQPSYQTPWLRFMCRMQQGGYSSF